MVLLKQDPSQKGPEHQGRMEKAMGPPKTPSKPGAGSHFANDGHPHGFKDAGDQSKTKLNDVKGHNRGIAGINKRQQNSKKCGAE